MLYKDIYSILKINGSLTRPFSVSRGIRQGCGLSGLLYAISIEPLLVMLRARLGTIAAPGIPQAPTVSLTAYADDVTVILQSQEDVKLLSQVLQTYQRAASAILFDELVLDYGFVAFGRGRPRFFGPKRPSWGGPGGP